LAGAILGADHRTASLFSAKRPKKNSAGKIPAEFS
jgi:hypothetical protein